MNQPCRIKWCCAVTEKFGEKFCKIHQKKLDRLHTPTKLSMQPPDISYAEMLKL